MHTLYQYAPRAITINRQRVRLCGVSSVGSWCREGRVLYELYELHVPFGEGGATACTYWMYLWYWGYKVTA